MTYKHLHCIFFMKQFKQLNLETFTSKGYALTPVEFKDVVPFEVKRLYYISDFKDGAQTGEHCHFVEEEVFIVARGSVTAVIDRGQGKEELELKGLGDAVYVPNYVWHGFKNASADCLIIALSSTNYRADRSDYQENYNEYLTVRDSHLAV